MIDTLLTVLAWVLVGGLVLMSIAGVAFMAWWKGTIDFDLLPNPKSDDGKP